MAIDTNVRYSMTVVDELGTESSNTYYADVDGSGTTVAAALAMWNTLAQKADAVTAGVITKGAVTILADPAAVAMPALKTTAIAGSRVEQSTVLNFLNGESTKRYGQLVSALRNTLIVSGKLDLSSGSAATALVNFLLAASSTFEWANQNQQAILSLRDAIISFRKRRKQLSRSSFEL